MMIIIPPPIPPIPPASHPPLSVVLRTSEEGCRPYVALFKGPRDTPPLVPNPPEVFYMSGRDVTELASALVLTLSNADATICDPFMAKGIVGEATLAMGKARKYIGIEREPGLFLYALNVLGSR